MSKGIGKNTLLYRIELLTNISYDEFRKYYIDENHDQKSTMDYFDLSRICDFNVLRDAYNCVKDRKSISKTVAEHNLTKYGVSNISSLDDVKEKKGQTTIRHYGVDNYSKTDEFKNGLKRTMLDKYGVDAPMKVPEFAAKCGAKVKAGWDSGSTRQKVKNTMLEKYGVENSLQLPQCTIKGGMSKPEKEIDTLLTEMGIEHTREFPLHHYRYDFKVGNTLIEVDPSATHNSTWGAFNNTREKDYHKVKSDTAKSNGYRCIHIFDWEDPVKVLSLLIPRRRVYARKCECRVIDQTTANKLLNEHHIQGGARLQTYCLGLYYEDTLVSVMTFGEPRYNKKYEWELIRYCSTYDVIGGANKLWAHFIADVNPKSVISYCDFSKFNGDTYLKLGMKYKSISIGKHWYNLNTGDHITDNFLRQRGFDQIFHTNYGKGTSNKELMLENGYVEVYDCGQITFEWKSST